MKIRAFIAVLAVAALSAGSCEEITTRTESTRLTAAITVGGSPFVADGKYLIGDEVTFSATVTDEAGDEVAIGDLTFSSDDPSVVQILDASSGQARFSGVGPTTVSVVIGEPSLQGVSEKLGAAMQVQVTEYEVALALTSTVTSSAVDPANALDGDVLRLVPDVTLDGQPAASAIRSINSSDTNVIDPAAIGAVDQVALVDTGSARLTVRFDEPDIPGSAPLTATIDVTVKDFVVEIDLESLVASSSHLAGGDTLETDSVVFRATVVRGVSDTLKNNTSAGTRWTSSRPGVIGIVNDTIGRFLQADTATVSVTFDDLDLPGEPFARSLRVSTFDVTLDLESLITGPGALADSLESDTVRVLEAVELNGAPRSSAIERIESSDASRILPIGVDTAVFADTGSATISVTLAQPTLPQDSLRASLPVRVATYLAAISGPQVTPIMGDTVDYDVTVTYTRDNSTVAGPTVTFSSTDASVIQVINAGNGMAFVRDTGQARVAVVSNSPTLPAAVVSDTTAVTNIVEERFYGAFSDTTGLFGPQLSAVGRDFAAQHGDTVIVQSSVVHTFTSTTRVEFPNGVVAYVDSVASDLLRLLVPAGADTGRLVMRNLLDDQSLPRDSVPIRFDFNAPGPQAVDDLFEDNDMMPLTASVEIAAFPFDALLAIDHNKVEDPGPPPAPADTNFFYFVLNSAQTLTFTAQWSDDADLDFKLCNGDSPPPPADYQRDASLNPICQFFAQSSDRTQEVVSNFDLNANIYVLAVYCVDCPPGRPVTYQLRVE